MGKYLGKSLVAKLWTKVKEHVASAVDTAKTAVGNYTVNGKKISTNPTLGKGDVGLGNVTNDAQVKRTEMGAVNGVATLGADGKLTVGQLPGMKTVNGESILGSGDITIDLSLYKVVESLPSTDIDANKVYLVLSGTEGTQNIYTEYLYVNNKWEKVGEYKADVDLTPYVKFTDLASAAKAGAMSKEDYTLLHETATGLATLKGRVDNLVSAGGEPNVLESVKVNGTALAVTDKAVNIPAASSTTDGVMSAEDKVKMGRFVFGPVLTTATGDINILDSQPNKGFRQIVAAAAKVKEARVIYGDTAGTADATYTCVVGDKGAITLTLQGGGIGAIYKDINNLSGTISSDMITLNGSLSAVDGDVTFEYVQY